MESTVEVVADLHWCLVILSPTIRVQLNRSGEQAEVQPQQENLEVPTETRVPVEKIESTPTPASATNLEPVPIKISAIPGPTSPPPSGIQQSRTFHLDSHELSVVPKQESKPDALPLHERDHELDEEFKVGDYRYKLTSMVHVSEIEETHPTQGEVFVLVNYMIENCTKESQVVRAEDFKVIDSKGRVFKPSSKVETALVLYSRSKDFMLAELQPGVPRQMTQGFELPRESLGSPVTVVVPKKGLFQRGEARVTTEITAPKIIENPRYRNRMNR